MDDAPQDLTEYPSIANQDGIGLSVAQWRMLAIVAAAVALLWPTISMLILLAGGPYLQVYGYDVFFPNSWLIAFALGFLLARTDAVHLAGIGALISALVAILFYLTVGDSAGESFRLQVFTDDGEHMSFIAVLLPAVIPWLWIAVMTGLGAIVGQRWGNRLGLVGS